MRYGIRNLDGPALYVAAQSTLRDSTQVDIESGHALLCATQAVAQALLALTAATVDTARPSTGETSDAWRRAVHP